MKGATRELLQAGCIYEYARESPKLRGLLVLMNPNRKREPFEIETRPRSGKQRHLPCSFEGLREKDARHTLGHAMLRWLSGLADELADNESFTELLRTSEKQLERSLPKLQFHRPLSAAIDLPISFPFEGQLPWPLQTFSSTIRKMKAGEGLDLFRRSNRPDPEDDGSEMIAVVIRWRDFRNSEIAKGMRGFAESNRPPSEPEPKRKGQKPEETIRANLKALSVMRIWKRFPKARDLGKRICETAKYAQYQSVLKEAAEYKTRSWQGHSDTAKSKAAQVQMYNARNRALSYFQMLFPSQKPSNY